MKPYPLVEELLAPVHWLAMPRAAGSPAFLRHSIPPQGKRNSCPETSHLALPSIMISMTMAL